MSDVVVSDIGKNLAPASPALQNALDWADRYDGRIQDVEISFPPSVMAEAAGRLKAAAYALAPAGADRVRTWLEQINLALTWPLPTKEFDLRAPVVAEALSGLPRDAFTRVTRVAAAHEFRRFPGAADVKALLAPEIAKLRRRERLLKAVADKAPRPRSEKPKDPAEITRIADAFRAKVGAVLPPVRSAEEQIAALGTGKPALGAKYLTPDQIRRVRAGEKA